VHLNVRYYYANACLAPSSRLDIAQKKCFRITRGSRTIYIPRRRMDLRPRSKAVATSELRAAFMQGQKLPGRFARRVIGVAARTVFGIFASPYPRCA